MAKQILLVEDNEDIRVLVKLILDDAGYTVLPAESGEDGLRLLQDQPIDLAILDIMLPTINGWEVCRQIRNTPRLAHLPVLIFTVRSERLDRSKPERDLADGFLNKPFEKQELLEAVKQMLEREKQPL